MDIFLSKGDTVKRRACLIIFIIWGMGSILFAQPKATATLNEWLQKNFDHLVQIRRHLHMYPELSNREHKTANYIESQLRTWGFKEIYTGIAKTGVVAVLRGKGKHVVAIRADMDALPVEEVIDVPYKSRNPGVKHACGHDLHMTTGLGTAWYFIDRMKKGWQPPGTIVFIFQPAEEGPPPGEEGGARLMVKEGVISRFGIETIFGMHSSPFLEVGNIGYSIGPALASADRFEIHIHGKQTHGAFPQGGIDPIFIGAQLVLQFQGLLGREVDARSPAVISVGRFEAGNRFNIIPGEAVLEGTVRTLDENTRSL